MEPKNNFKQLGVGAMALTGVVMFSAKSVFAKLAYAYNADPVTVLYLRMVIALPLVFVIGFVYEMKKGFPAIEWRDVAMVALFSVLGYYISAVFNFIGLQYVEASIERLILFLYPTMVLVLSAIFLKKGITPKQIAAIVVSYIGLLLAFADRFTTHTSHLFWFGALLIVFSSLTYAIFLTAADGLIARIGAVRFTSIASVTMGICTIVHAMCTGHAQLTGINHNVLFYCGLMAVFSTVIPVYLFNIAMGKLGASNVSIISCLGPICTLLYSAALLSERITVWQILGTLVVMGGILILYVKHSKNAIALIKDK